MRLGIDATTAKPYSLGMDVKTATAALAAAKVRRFDGAPVLRPSGSWWTVDGYVCRAGRMSGVLFTAPTLAEVVALACR